MAELDTKKPSEPPHCGCSENECTKVTYKEAEITVPIELLPSASVNGISIECCGDPEVKCTMSSCCDCCELSVSQRIKIKIPVAYKVNACIGKSDIDCCDKK